MCGIAGIAAFGRERALPEPIPIEAMLDSMYWRGPNAKGIWYSDFVAMGHLRLSIIDLSVAANQPMTNRSGITIIFNGEIYNYKDLRAILKPNCEFMSQSDTEVVLASYSEWGPDCVKKFNGDWAFAIYDDKRNIVMLSRDRFGVKPLYYYNNGRHLYFASEVRSILAAKVNATIPIRKIAQFLKFRQIEQRYETIYDEIYPIEPGKNVIVNLTTGKFDQKKYYVQSDLFLKDVPLDENEASEVFGTTLRDAVRLRLQADVPVQILLSGGIDSSAIAALAKSLQDNVCTLSYVSPGIHEDESYFSNMVAHYLQTDHHCVTLSGLNFFDTFDTVIEAQDFPTCSEKHVARYLLYQKASDYATVVLEGQGGDEVFGGYGRLYQIYQKYYQNDATPILLMKAPEKRQKSDLPPLTELHPDIRRKVGKVKRHHHDCPIDDPYLNRQMNILGYNLLSLLHTGDRLQMYNSIEGRYPFLDHRIVELGMSLPLRFKMWQYDKYLLRFYLKTKNMLPNEIVHRTDKKGFATGMDEFLLKSVEARSHFFHIFVQGTLLFPGLFDMKSMKRLLSEQYDFGLNNNRRLLAIYALIKYLHKSNCPITGIN